MKKGGFRINRNIVECKCVADSEERNSIWELIETLWNVNKQEKTTCKQRRHELIETLWNVN